MWCCVVWCPCWVMHGSLAILSLGCQHTTIGPAARQLCQAYSRYTSLIGGKHKMIIVQISQEERGPFSSEFMLDRCRQSYGQCFGSGYVIYQSGSRFFYNADPDKKHIFSKAITKISGKILVFNQKISCFIKQGGFFYSK